MVAKMCAPPSPATRTRHPPPRSPRPPSALAPACPQPHRHARHQQGQARGAGDGMGHGGDGLEVPGCAPRASVRGTACQPRNGERGSLTPTRACGLPQQGGAGRRAPEDRGGGAGVRGVVRGRGAAWRVGSTGAHARTAPTAPQIGPLRPTPASPPTLLARRTPPRGAVRAQCLRQSLCAACPWPGPPRRRRALRAAHPGAPQGPPTPSASPRFQRRAGARLVRPPSPLREPLPALPPPPPHPKSADGAAGPPPCCCPVADPPHPSPRACAATVRTFSDPACGGFAAAALRARQRGRTPRAQRTHLLPGALDVATQTLDPNPALLRTVEQGVIRAGLRAPRGRVSPGDSALLTAPTRTGPRHRKGATQGHILRPAAERTRTLAPQGVRARGRHVPAQPCSEKALGAHFPTSSGLRRSNFHGRPLSCAGAPESLSLKGRVL